MALEKIQPRDNSYYTDRVLIGNRKKKHRKNLYILKTKALYRIISIFDSQSYVHFKAVNFMSILGFQCIKGTVLVQL